MGKKRGFLQHFPRNRPLRRGLGTFPENRRTKRDGKRKTAACESSHAAQLVGKAFAFLDKLKRPWFPTAVFIHYVLHLSRFFQAWSRSSSRQAKGTSSLADWWRMNLASRSFSRTRSRLSASFSRQVSSTVRS